MYGLCPVLTMVGLLGGWAGCSASVDGDTREPGESETLLEALEHAIEADDDRSRPGEPTEEPEEWPRATHTDGERSLDESARLALGDEGYARIMDAQRGAGLPAGELHAVAHIPAIEGDACATDDDAPREEPPHVDSRGRALPGEIAPRRTPLWARAGTVEGERDAVVREPVAPAVLALQADWVDRGCAAPAEERRAECADHAYRRHLAASMLRDPEIRPDRRRGAAE